MLKPAIRYLLLLAMCLSGLGAGAGELRLQGPDEVVGLLRPYLPADERSPQRLQTLFGEILATEGYFSPGFNFVTSGEVLTLSIDPGPRTTIAGLDLVIDGAVDEPTRQRLRGEWRLPVGQPFRQAMWNEAKQQLLGKLLAVDYADARLLDSQARIETESHQAFLTVRYDAGPRYRFGALHYAGLGRYTPELIAHYNRVLDAGDAYSEDKLNALQGALQGTPYFSSVDVRLERESAVVGSDGTATAPVLITVRERAAHRLAFGAGASSNTGARVEANYHTPNFANQAWALDSGLRLEQKKQTLFADIFLPPDQRDRRHSFGAIGEATDIQGLKTRRTAFGAQSVQQRGSIEQRLSLNWESEHRQPDGADGETSQALVPNVMWTWRKLDNLLDPRRGVVLMVQVGGGARAALSDQNFVRLHGRGQVYLPLGQRDTLALRGEIGYTLAESRQRIPQDYLFRTGGTGSVRGYAYQSLGIREGSAVVGGRYLAVVSAEATHWLNERWGVAAFVDAGDAVDQKRDARLAVGYGLGGRWRSPAGPIGVDLAYGERFDEVHLHFSLAIPF